MKTVVIISEYNPFHYGHKYHVDSIRKEFGPETGIVAVMSGNFTQRAELAIIDKFARAEAAVKCGVDLVVELPFPFSASSAEFFARSGVFIANELKADYISFGSEIGNLGDLNDVAENMISTEFQSSLSEELKKSENKQKGYPVVFESVYRILYKKIPESLFSPNNILALEYLKAIKKFKFSIIPHTVKRIGAGYSESELINTKFQSATAIRMVMKNNVASALSYLPEDSRDTIDIAYKSGFMPTDENKLSSAILSHFRIKRNEASNDIQDADFGLYNRLKNAAFEAKDISSLITLADTKKYTTARIRRVIWYSFFGVTSSDVKELPKYTQVLAMNAIGQEILKSIKKSTGISIITKPSSYKSLNEDAKRQKELSDIADSVYQLAKPICPPGNTALRSTPFVQK